MGKLKQYDLATDSWITLASGGVGDSGGSGTTFATDFYGTMSGDFTHNSSGNWRKAPFDTATRDTNTEFNATTDLWVCATSGTYVIACSLRWTANATGYRGAFISVNGDSTAPTTAIADVRVNNGASYAGRCAICMPIALSASDTIGIYCIQSSGGSLKLLTQGSYFCIWRIA